MYSSNLAHAPLSCLVVKKRRDPNFPTSNELRYEILNVDDSQTTILIPKFCVGDQQKKHWKYFEKDRGEA